MSDKLTEEQRRRNMQRIKSKDTSIEVKLANRPGQKATDIGKTMLPYQESLTSP